MRQRTQTQRNGPKPTSISLSNGNPKSSRGQTLTDFAMGMGMFLLVVGFVFMNITTFMAPFTTTANEGVVPQTQRSASYLTEDVLSVNGDTTPDTVLDEQCVKLFFDTSGGSSVPHCEHTDDSLKNALGIRDYDGAHVTIVDVETGSVATIDGVTLDRGEPIPQGTKVYTNTRVVQIDGSVYKLNVYMW